MKINNKILFFSLIVILLIILFLYIEKKPVRYSTPTIFSSQKQTSAEIQPPIFSWYFENSDKIDLDGLPETNIYLKAQYINNIIKNELIDTVQGSCNELLNYKEGMLSNTQVIQCYAAGYGDRYKITQGTDSYLIEHQEFQEASPDYNTTPSSYKVIYQFPLSLDNNISETQSNIKIVDGRQCYSYSQEDTKDAPYTVNEFMDITVKGNSVNGTKKGTQNGPDMTNGYTGTLNGNLNKEKNSMMLVYSYTVEGSHNKEKETYQSDKTGIEKLRYPLIEEKEILVPDTTKDYTIQNYSRVECKGSN